jgi:ADP-L-glycero-D-manno-heptose 6-epimerase
MIVVTGGAGFIGSNIVGTLSSRRIDIVVNDFLRGDNRWRNLARHDIADIIHPDGLFEFLQSHVEEIDAIVHMGAISDTTEQDVGRLVQNNIRLSLDLVDWCARHGKRLIYASSGATYGDGSAGFDDDETPDRLACLKPLNPYGWSKHFVDRRIAWLKAQGRPMPAQIVGLKFFNVYGPNEYHKGAMRSVIHQIFPQAQKGDPVRLFKSAHPDYSDGGQLRDFIYVRDCVKVVQWFLDHPQVSGLFNLGTGRARSFADLAQAVFAALEREPNIAYVDMPAQLQGRYQYFTQANMSKLRAAGYVGDFTELEDGVRDYIRTYLVPGESYA